MIFGALTLDEAPGAVVAHTHRLPGRVLRKGTVLDDAAIAALRAGGHDTVIAARLDADDVMEDQAALRLATALVGPGLELGPATTGRVNLLATRPSLLRVDPACIDAINRLDEALTVATLPDWSTAAPGDMVATIKVIPFAVGRMLLAAAEATAHRLGPAFEMHPFQPRRCGLVLSVLTGMKDSVIDGTIEAMSGRVEALGGRLLPPRRVAHTQDAIATALRGLLDEGAEMLLIAGASATVDRRDIGPSAVVAVGGEITHFGMPVDPGNLICLGRVGAVPALVLPGCARSPKTNGIDWVMQRLAAGLPVDGADLMGMGVGGLLKESDVRPMPRLRHRRRAGPPAVASIVLAAGTSSRSGPAHKLLARDPGGTAMLARTVDQALASAARPVVVVVGHRASEMRSAIAGRDVVIVTAEGYEQGLSSSLKAGIAALPAESQAALICLGDMPLVSFAVMDRLIAAWDRDEGRLVVQPTSAGRPGNPVLLDRTLFARLEALQGDVGARGLLAGMADEVVGVEVGTDAVLRDFDTAASLREWTQSPLPAPRGTGMTPPPPTADGPVKVATAPDGVRAYVSAVPPEALPSVRARDLAAAWEAARERAMRHDWGEARFFRFPRRDGPTTELALADPDACCWAAAIEQTTGLASLAGLSLCLRLLALVHLLREAAWSRAWVSFRRDGASLDPRLLDAAARLPLTAQGLLDQAQLRRQLAVSLPDAASSLPVGASA